MTIKEKLCAAGGRFEAAAAGIRDSIDAGARCLVRGFRLI